uniref:Phage tail collar domain-containing protein n=1 Tax=uncultured prokaryote TaxID=198431 RepID=A0A0H5Q3U7_9ZZZZ|nr:hypothetical protein [uncultured prokaryote]
MNWKFLTPNTVDFVGRSVRRFFCVDVGMSHFLTGCLDELTSAGNWERFGDVDAVTMAEFFEGVIDTMGNCDGIGQLIPTVGDAPYGCLLLDGSSYAVDDYPGLAAAMPSWVNGSGIDLPDMTNAYLVGGDGLNIGEYIGANTHTLTVEEMPAHSHDYVSAAVSVSTVAIPDEPSAVPSAAVTSPVGGGSAHNNMPLSLAVKWYVVAK